MLKVVLNKSWKQHLSKQQLYGHLPPISYYIQNEQDMQGIAGEAMANSKVMFSYGLQHREVPV